ncbi:stalk domain-containing protein [Paenibacillus woosongensis]|uniref:Copper amine oxidase-like N-terminal domain-containing protein n=1 Tax=Paenibacillus woosongensis TaxID=307580 RepID=A0A7X2Z0I8_9BACL|nr:stalk domain-containing protein [Paenibacillus woosongensis]MUG45215.1 hypothetical protein [Paenibacillus woosongensis]
MTRSILTLYVFALTLVFSSIQAYASSSPVLFQDKILVVDNVKTEISLALGDKISSEIVVTGQDVGVRDFFKLFTDEVAWDNQNKEVIVKNKGKQLVISLSGKVTTQDNQIILPDGWAYLEDGKAYLKFPYLAYLFDRYGEFESDSEEYQWKEMLSFLNIEYIDTNNSSPKDRMVHSFVMIKAK